ncbi:phage protein NinX family protein [Morganella morganii]|uniref:phage protein NinX family protein n=1 Tax=Morganella morganii TaxID=582 RepID=UPI001EFADCFB|nr:phage protein NinX family protein [Morganella morganii]
MNKYRDKSDFEINLRVAQIIFTDSEYDVIKQSMEVVKFQNGNGKGTCHAFDPCNNPADAFPLIIDVKLSIHPDFYNNCESWIVRTVHIPPVKDKSLTRAICIAYLMMKDAENEKV